METQGGRFLGVLTWILEIDDKRKDNLALGDNFRVTIRRPKVEN